MGGVSQMEGTTGTAMGAEMLSEDDEYTKKKPVTVQ